MHSKVKLTEDLLFEFLGGIVVVKNPDCCFRGLGENMSFERTDRGITTIGFLFPVLEDIPLNEQVFTATGSNTLSNYPMIFEIRPEGVLFDNILTIPTTLKGEVLVIKKAA